MANLVLSLLYPLNILSIEVIRFICFPCDLVNVVGNNAETVQQRCKFFHIIEAGRAVKHRCPDVFRGVRVTSLSPALDDLPFLDIKVDVLAVYLFIFSCYVYQSFLY